MEIVISLEESVILSQKTNKQMSKKSKSTNNQANQKNANKGTNGTNKQYDKVHGNRGKQLNPNWNNKKENDR